MTHNVQHIADEAPAQSSYVYDIKKYPYWTDDDFAHKNCLREHVGLTKEFWTELDVQRGLCPPAKLGDVKLFSEILTPEADALALQVAQLTNTPKQLRKDVLEAYRQLGGVKFLMKTPLLLEKLLVKIITEDKTTINNTVVKLDIPWITPGGGRLSYRDNLVDLGPALEANKQIEQGLKD